MKVTLRALRVNRGLTQSEAAEKIGVTRQTIQKWEASETFPTMKQLATICSVYGCGMGDIFLPNELARREC